MNKYFVNAQLEVDHLLVFKPPLFKLLQQFHINLKSNMHKVVARSNLNATFIQKFIRFYFCSHKTCY